MRLDWKGLVGIGISLVLLWWVFRGQDLGMIAGEIARADFLLLGGAVAVATFGFVIRAWRWKVLLHPLRPDTGFRPRFASVCIGFMANNLLPLRVGEFARAWALGRLEAVTVSGAFASLVVERLLDFLVILGLLLVAVGLPSFPSDVLLTEGPLGAGLRWALVLLAIMVVGLLALLVLPRQMVTLVERLSAPLPDDVRRPVTSAMEAFLDGLEILRSPRLLVLALAWTVGLWTWHCLAFWLGFRAFGIEVGYGPALLVNATTAFGAAIPSAPAFFGTFHAGAVAGLTGVYGVVRSSSLSFAVGFHLAGFVPVTLLGLWYLGRMGFSLKEIQESEAKVEDAVEEAHQREETP